MINLAVKVYPRTITVEQVETVDHAVYHLNPRFVADGVRVYMPRKHPGLSGRYGALCNVLLNALAERHIPLSSLVDTHKKPYRPDRRTKTMKEAHARTINMFGDGE